MILQDLTLQDSGLFIDLSLEQIIIIILALVSIYYAYKQYKISLHQQQKKSSAFEIVSKDELIKRLQLEKENYIDRKHLERIKLHEKPKYILIHGLSGVGKSREAIEIIQKIERSGLEEVKIYFAKKSVTAIPIDSLQVYQNVILFLDDLRPSLEPSSLSYEEEKGKLPSFHERLEKTVKLFEESAELNSVIITLLTDQYKILEDKFSNSNFLDKFSIIKLKKFSLKEKYSYIDNFADLFKISIDGSSTESLAKASDESLKKVRNFFKIKRDEGKTNINTEDIEEFKIKIKDEWMGAYSKLSPLEKSIFDALTKLYQFTIPAFIYVVEDFVVKGRFNPFRRSNFRKVLKKLDEKWLGIEENKVYCDDSRLSLKNPDDPKLSEDLKQMSLLIQRVSKKRKYQSDLYNLITPLTYELHRYGIYTDAIEFYNCILNLPHRALPIRLEKVKSKILFYKGHAYYSMGKIYWDKAKDCYEQSIMRNENNLFAKHALATIYHKQYDSLKALDLLDEITEANKKDFLAYGTKLEIYIDTGISLKRAREAYKAIKGLLKSNNLPRRAAVSAELACIRFLVRLGEFFQEKGKFEKTEKQFQESIKQFKDLIDRIPSGEHELEAIIRNTYACFLYDILGKIDDGITQLKKAQKAWPKHIHSLHKLATIYLEVAEIGTKKRARYIKKAKDCIDKALKINPCHYLSLLTFARLEGESIDWGSLKESEFWEKISYIYDKYKEALEPESATFLSQHNLIVHHSAGCFLWHIEPLAHKLDFLSKPPSIPSADVEFGKSINIEKQFEKTIPRNIKGHLILAYYTIGAYFMTAAAGSHDIYQKGQSFLLKAIRLSKEMKSRFKFYSQNSYAESFVGKILLSMNEKDEAKKYLKSAVKRFDKNWRAWWWLGGIYEIDKEYYPQAFTCLYKSADGQASPKLFGHLRSIVQDWLDEGKIAPHIDLKLKCSQRAYELDPNGDQDFRNISDYAHDLLQEGTETADQDILKEAKELFMLTYKKNMKIENKNEASYHLWHAIMCQEKIEKRVDTEILKMYIELATLEGSELSYTKLNDKALNYCFPIWKSGQIVDADIVSEIEVCANHHLEYPVANIMIGIVLQRNRENKRALPYLKKVRTTKDTFVLRALMECYYALEKKQQAEEVCQEIYSLLEGEEKKKLRDRASKLGLKFS